MKFLKLLCYGLATLVAVGIVALLAALWIYRDIPAETLEAKYANEASRFMNIDGVRLHYRDEGSGPPVVLIHANFASLIGWDPWVEALKDSYRIIRFDMTSHGLTGPDPSGDYTLERTIALTESFTDALGLGELTIGGTSLGGTVAIHYSVRHPDRVQRLILLSPGSLEGRERTAGPNRAGVPDAAKILEYVLPRALPRFMLTSGFGERQNLSEGLVERWHDMWLYEGQRHAQLSRLRQYSAGDIEGIIRRISVPTLLLWGEANPQAPIEQAYEILELLEDSAAEITFISYPGVGHMAVQEAGPATARDVRAYLDGELAEGSATTDKTAATPELQGES